MGRRVANARAAGLTAFVVALAFLCASSAGCNNSCVGFFSNPSGGTLSVDINTCSVKQTQMGNVRLRFGAPADSVESWRAAGIQHVFLTLREIDARLEPDSADGSVEWHNLAPKLQQRPVQIDLMAGDDDSPSAHFADEATLPTGAYTQVRILLASDQGEHESILPENGCVSEGLNCVVTRDGNRHFLHLPTGQLLVSFSNTAGAILHVLHDTTSNLDLEFRANASQVYTLGKAAWFNPVFSAHSTFSSASD